MNNKSEASTAKEAHALWGKNSTLKASANSDLAPFVIHLNARVAGISITPALDSIRDHHGNRKVEGRRHRRRDNADTDRYPLPLWRTGMENSPAPVGDNDTWGGERLGVEEEEHLATAVTSSRNSTPVVT